VQGNNNGQKRQPSKQTMYLLTVKERNH